MTHRMAQLEQRMTGVEGDVSEIKGDLKSIRSDVAYIRGRLDAMPTTIQLLMGVVGIFVAAGIVRWFQ